MTVRELVAIGQALVDPVTVGGLQVCGRIPHFWLEAGSGGDPRRSRSFIEELHDLGVFIAIPAAIPPQARFTGPRLGQALVISLLLRPEASVLPAPDRSIAQPQGQAHPCRSGRYRRRLCLSLRLNVGLQSRSRKNEPTRLRCYLTDVVSCGSANLLLIGRQCRA